MIEEVFSSFGKLVESDANLNEVTQPIDINKILKKELNEIIVNEDTIPEPHKIVWSSMITEHDSRNLNFVDIILCTLILPVCCLIYLFLMLFWCFSIIYKFILIKFGVFSESSLISVNNCIFTKTPNNYDSFDHLLHRIPPLFYIFAFKVFGEYFIKWITGMFKHLPLMNDDELLMMLLSGPISRDLNIDKINKKIVCKLHYDSNRKNLISPLEIKLFPNQYLSVKDLVIDIKNKKLIINVIDDNNNNIEIIKPSLNDINYSEKHRYNVL